MYAKCRQDDVVTPPQALKVLNMIKLHGKPIRVNKATQDKQHMNVGANLFIGNLDPSVDEKVCVHLVMVSYTHPHTTPTAAVRHV